MTDDYLLQVQNLHTWFTLKKGFTTTKTTYVKAVNDLSFEIKKGEILGLVGESGCGKTTAGRSILRLVRPTSGKIIFKNLPVLELSSKAMRALRKEMQIIFQDPYSSLNPRYTVGKMLSEVLTVHGLSEGSSLKAEVYHLLDMVGLKKAHYYRYPHEFSGGQRQRLVIARTLSVRPSFIICDEPVSALDVSVQSQILNLLEDMQKQLNLTYIFISHDLSVVAHISSRIAVMYLGKIVEIGTAKEVFHSPKHPYSQMLFSSIPSLDPTKKTDRILPQGEVPSPSNIPSGCAFHSRCPYRKDQCIQESPPLTSFSETHSSSCFLYE